MPPDPSGDSIRIKICGLTSAADAVAAAESGADYLGFNFFPPSPRSVPLDAAGAIMAPVPEAVTRVALVVDADDALIRGIAALPVDMIQLHGAETPERAAEIRRITGLPVMKVIGIRTAEDLPGIDQYAGVVDQLMVDAKPPKGAVLPGGNGIQFDWTLIAGRDWTVPWMLAGGLTPENVAEAIRLTGARQVDVASGVEASPGVKDAAKVRAFAASAREAA